MEELLKLLESDVAGALKVLTAQQKNKGNITDRREEFNEIARDSRETQIDKIQLDKNVGEGEKAKIVKAVKIPVPFQNKIVNTATAFEVGAPVTLIPNNTDNLELSDEISRLWEVNRVDSVLQEAIKLQKSELQSAIVFHIKDLSKSSLYNRVMGVNQNKDIKAKLLKNENGVMSPYFDAFGDMKSFTWEYSTTNSEGTEVKNILIYTDKLLYTCSDESGKLIFVRKDAHGFDKIPVVYLSQEKPEWFIAEKMIDRLEVSMSKLGAANDYSGQPILVLYGSVQGAPDKDEDGKAIICDIQIDPETEKEVRSDVKFLTHDNAPASVKLELDRLEKYIYSLTSTPDLSFDNLKGLGTVSGVALQLMFLDAILKAKMNEGQNRTVVQRVLNVFISGTVTTTVTKLKSHAKATYFKVKFNSIIPNDLKTSVETFSKAIESGMISKKTSIDNLGISTNSEDEIKQIELEKETSNKDL